jgi:hypothetical protein
MIDFYIKQNLGEFQLKEVLKNILKLDLSDFCLVKYDNFNIGNKEIDFNSFKVVCVYDHCQGDVSLLINIVDGDILDNEVILNSLQVVARENQIDFFCPDEETMDMGAFTLYSSSGAIIKNYEIREEDENVFFFLS